MDQKEGLAGERARPAIANLAKSELGDLDAGAQSIGVAAPVGDAVDATNWVGPEALDGAGGRHGSSGAVISVTFGW